MKPVPARPVVRDGGGGAIASFYPLHNYICPPASTSLGGAIITRMMRDKDVRVHWEHPRTTPTVIFCRACQLGIVSHYRVVIVECIHGEWSNRALPDVVAAKRLGAKVESCSLCGKSFYDTTPDWTWSNGVGFTGFTHTVPHGFAFCGKKCRARAQFMKLADTYA